MKVLPKTQSEIQIMKKGGKILHTILHEVGKHCIPGMTPKKLDEMAHELCKKYKVKPAFYGYMGFPGAICASVNDVVVHGIPSDVPLQAGDIIGIDFGVELGGFCTDSAYTFCVGEVSVETKEFLDTIQAALMNAISIAKHGVRLGDIGAVISDTIERGGYSVVEELGGHGIGKSVHENPHIFNFGNAGTGEKLVEGTTIALEPIANMGKGAIFTESDQWTIRTQDASFSGHFEHTIVIGKNKGEILT
jgi:methionyl aminopeptidase